MRLLLDMNLSPQWVQVLEARGHECHHWSQVGQGDDPDESLLVWAHTHGAVLITADLDFGLLLARSGQRSPSLVQIRSKGTLPEDIAESLVEALRTAEPHLSQGALVTVEPERHRVRILPIGPPA
jgi:predicted nuclease of predicted toxin-antitoxin system